MSIELASKSWRRSSYSGSAGGECVEVADLGVVIGLRDSKVVDSPVVTTGTTSWETFLNSLR